MAIDLDRLRANLLTSGLQKKDQPLFQVINQLIQAFKDLKILVDSGGLGGSSALALLGYLTADDEIANLPNSKELVAGTNINFDDSVANKRIINVEDNETHFDGYWTPLTDGDLDETELIFAAGDAVMMWVPTP